MTAPAKVTVAVRSEQLRGRVNDAATMLGHGDFDYGLKQFGKRAYDYGIRHNMRVWRSSKGIDESELAVSSLKNLLRLRVSATGRSDHWVLDLFEGVLEEIWHGVAPRHPADPAVDQLEVTGVQVEKEERSLAMRVLDAFTDRNAASMLELALEIEALELKGS